MKSLILKLWIMIPFGYICRFWIGNMRITFYKNGWICTDEGAGTVKDLLPITLVSQSLVDRIECEMRKIGYR